MACNNLGLWAFSGVSSNDLCSISPTVSIYGNDISYNTPLYDSGTCVVGLLDGFYSNGSITFEYDGVISEILGISGCSCSNEYCVNGTFTFDDTYVISGLFDGDPFFSGISTNYVIYYSSGLTKWCLSTTLGGTCDLFGPTGSLSQCPDLDVSLFYSGVCSTTTTTTDPCESFDFNAIFDCFITPTPTTTPPSTPTPTPTPTPTSSNVCGGLIAEIGGLKKTPLPSSSPTPTPTQTPDITRPCNFSGSVIFNSVDEIISCANSKKFKDCFTGFEYYSTENITDASGNTLNEGYVYSTLINGIGICAIYEGLVENISGIDSIDIISTIGAYSEGSCLECTPYEPSPVLECIIINSECGIVNLNPSGFINGKLYYTWSFANLNQYIYRIYWDSINLRWVVEETTTNLVGAYLPIDSQLPVGSHLDWVFFNTINASTSCIEESSGFFTSLLSVPCPTPTPTPTPTPSASPCLSRTYTVSNNAGAKVSVSYTDCVQGVVTLSLNPYSSYQICSSTMPTTLNPLQVFISTPGVIC